MKKTTFSILLVAASGFVSARPNMEPPDVSTLDLCKETCEKLGLEGDLYHRPKAGLPGYDIVDADGNVVKLVRSYTFFKFRREDVPFRPPSSYSDDKRVVTPPSAPTNPPEVIGPI